MRFSPRPFIVACALAVSACAASSANAALQVTLVAGSSSMTIADGGSGDYDGVANGEIEVYKQMVGGYEFRMSLSSSNSPGTNQLAILDSNVGRVSGTAATTVKVIASANGFVAPVTPPDLEITTDMTANLSGLPTNTADVSVRSYVDTSNNLSATGEGTLVGISSAEDVHAATLTDVVLLDELVAPYTITLVMEATFNQTGNAMDLDGGVTIVPTPEPSTMVIWGAGLLGFVALGNRRRQGLVK